MSTTYNHSRLKLIDENGNEDVIYPENTLKDVKVNSDNTSLPSNTDTMKVVVDNLGSLAFTDKISRENLNDDLAAIIDNILYTEISINSFTNDKGILELGTNLSNLTLTWSINKIPTTISLQQNIAGDTSSVTVNTTDNSKAITFSTPINSDYITFTLSVTDEKSVNRSKTSSVYFYNSVYYGVSSVNTTDGITNDFIKGLTKTLTDTKTRSINVNPGSDQYIYYCLPDRLGIPSFSIDGFQGGFVLFKTLNFTNSSNYTESYSVYKSVNPNLGDTTISII